MTHTGPMHESEGRFSAERVSVQRCRGKCARLTDHKCQTWESNDGAYEDYKFTCLECSNVFWIDGIDS